MANNETPETGVGRLVNWAKRVGQTPLFGGGKPKGEEKQGLADDIFLLRWAKGLKHMTSAEVKVHQIPPGVKSNAPDLNDGIVEEAEAEAAKTKAETKQRAEAEAGQKARALQEAGAEAAKTKAETKQQAEAEAGQKARAFQEAEAEAARIKAETRQQAEADAKQQARILLKEAEAEAARVKAETKQQAEAEAKQQVRMLLEEAEAEAARVKAETKQQAEAEAKQQAHTLLKEAEAEAARVRAETKQQAEADARQQARAHIKEAEAEAARVKAETKQQAEAKAKQQARMLLKEAEAEAARIVAEAKRQGQEIASDAKIRAAGATQLEANEILITAKGKAEIIEATARQQATEFLAKAREQMLDEISTVNDIWTQEVKGAYFRLFSSLHDLMADVEQVQAGWRNKTAELLERKSLELKEYDTRLFPPLEEAELVGDPQRDYVEESLGSNVEHDIQQPMQPQEEEAAPPKSSTSEEDLGSTAEHDIQQPIQPQEEEATPPKSTPETTKPPNPHITQKKGKNAQDAYIKQQDPNTNYVGEVELSLIPPVDLAKMSELYEHLQTIADIKVLRTVGSWDRGTVITVMVDKPTLLINIINESMGSKDQMGMSVIETAVPLKSSSVGSRNKAVKRIEIRTAMASGS
ncbi:hypothetical protein ACFLTS_04395 [Chloroflexota bacterium]